MRCIYFKNVSILNIDYPKLSIDGIGVEINHDNKNEIFENYGREPLKIGELAEGHIISINSENILRIRITDGTIKNPILFYIVTENSEIGFSNSFLEKCSAFSYKTIVEKIDILSKQHNVKIFTDFINDLIYKNTDTDANIEFQNT